MNAIVLGQNLTTNKPVKFDVASFLRSRLLFQASSGGGKSWTLRRLLEQTHRLVQQIVIDLEDEFYTLREKHDYVLGRPGGDFAVTIQSAELLARTLLETKVSAIISLAELPLHERAIFVKRFLNALVNAPRNLWHSVLVVVDEAHLFCPQKGDVESKRAVIDLLTRGRKRGYIGALATQRLAKLDKDAAAECNVKLIGLCNLPADRARATEELGFDKEEERAKRKAFGKLRPGNFFVSGPGIDAEDGIVELKVGPVETTHPEPGASDIGVTPPTARVRKALSKLGDLPKEAAAELKTIKELQAKVRELEAGAPKIVEHKPVVQVEIEEKPVLKEADVKRLGTLIERLEKAQARTVEVYDHLGARLLDVRTALGKVLEHRQPVGSGRMASAAPPRGPAPKPMHPQNRAPNTTRTQAARLQSTLAKPSGPRGEALNLPVGEAAVLDALIQFTAGLERAKLSVLTKYKRSTRDAYIARLEQKGLVTVGPGTLVTATQAGHDARPDAQPLPTGKALQDHWLATLPAGEAEILRVLLAAGGDTVAHVAIDEETKFKRSTRDAYLSRMEAKQIVVRGNGVTAASPHLF